MKRYWIFVYQRYYPCGGMDDFCSSDDNLEVVEKKIFALIPDCGLGDAHVWDSTINKIIKRYDYNGEKWEELVD